MLINTVGTRQYRPPAATEMPNLLLAADYVRTHTDLASTEAANEAARRAVNAVLERESSAAPRCDLWEFEYPAVFEPARRVDELRWELGLPHPGVASKPLWRAYRRATEGPRTDVSAVARALGLDG